MEDKNKAADIVGQAQEFLGVSKEIYRSIFENAPASIVLSDEKGQIIDINPWHITHIGKGKTTKKDYIGKNVITYPSVVNAGLSEIYRKLHENGEPFDIKEVYFPTTSGGIPAYMNVKGVPLFKEGKIIGAITIHENITERIKIQEEIEKHYKVQDIVNSLLSISLEDISLEEQLQRVLDVIVSAKLVPIMPMAAIFLVDDEPNMLVLKAERGLTDALKAACNRVPFEKCLCGKAASSRKIIFTDSIDHQHDTQYKDIIPHGHYIIPILSQDKTLGVIMLYVQEGHRPNRQEEEFLQSVSGTVAGIIEQKKTQAALDSERRRLKLLYEYSPEGIVVLDTDYHITYANSKAEEISGLSLSKLKDNPCFDIIMKRTAPCDGCGVEEVKRTGKPHMRIKHEITAAGKENWIHQLWYPILDKDGKVESVVEILKDITEQKKAQEALEQSERFLSDIFNSIQDGISVLDKEMNIIMVSPALEKWYAHNMPLVGKKCFEAYHCRKSPCKVCPTKQTLQTGKPAYEVVPKRATGGQIVGWVELYTFPFFDTPSGQIKGVIEYVRDVTERRLVEEKEKELAAAKAKAETERAKAEELKQAYDKLKELQEKLIRSEKLAVLGKLAGVVGHELRNPLGVIRNVVYFLRMKLGKAIEDEKIKGHLDILEEEVDNSDRIITDILTFTKIKEPRLAETEVNELIKKTLKRVRLPLEIEVVTELRSELPRIMADVVQLEQVFYNIILNAIEAMPKGGRFTVTSIKKGDFLEIHISDTGKGIPKENLGKIFEPLFSTKPHGIGLGLSLCQDVIKGHKGRIEVESQEGKGTKFIIKLPIAKKKSPDKKNSRVNHRRISLNR